MGVATCVSELTEISLCGCTENSEAWTVFSHLGFGVEMKPGLQGNLHSPLVITLGGFQQKLSEKWMIDIDKGETWEHSSGSTVGEHSEKLDGSGETCNSR